MEKKNSVIIIDGIPIYAGDRLRVKASIEPETIGEEGVVVGDDGDRSAGVKVPRKTKQGHFTFNFVCDKEIVRTWEIVEARHLALDKWLD